MRRALRLASLDRPRGWGRINGSHPEDLAAGARSDRPELAKLIKRLDQGDVLIVTRLDRLARSTQDLLNLLDAIGKAGAGFKSLSDAWADTTTPHGRLMLTVLGGLRSSSAS